MTTIPTIDEVKSAFFLVATTSAARKAVIAKLEDAGFDLEQATAGIQAAIAAGVFVVEGALLIWVQKPMPDPLSHFAVPGVVDAAVAVKMEAYKSVRREFPADPEGLVKAGIQAAFLRANLSNEPITPELLSSIYRSNRAR